MAAKETTQTWNVNVLSVLDFVVKQTFLALNLLFFSLDAAEYVKVGCFKDDLGQRALPELLVNYRGNINWNTDLSYIVDKCAQEAKKKNYMYFR